MDRHTEILKFVTKEKRGIEIGPWHSPLAPKTEGYNCLSLDVYDATEQRKRLRELPDGQDYLADRIETVELVGSAAEIKSLVDALGELSAFDYVVSSHNIEHIPNPIKFIQGCGEVLKKGGVLSLAVPDRRVEMDYFRPFTTLAEWLEAYFYDQDRPGLTQIFESRSVVSRYKQGDELLISHSIGDDPRNVVPLPGLRGHFEWFKNSVKNKDTEYHDLHCWAFTPSSFKLLVTDLMHIRLSPFQILALSKVNGNEFYIHLQNVGYDADQRSEDEYYQERTATLHEIVNEAGSNSVRSRELEEENALLKIRITALESQAKPKRKSGCTG